MLSRKSVTGGLVAYALLCTAPVALAGVPDPRPTARDSHQPVQTSDRQPGEIAAAIPVFFQRPATQSAMATWEVAPGVTVTRWDEFDARGPIRAYLLTVDPTEPGVSVDYASVGPVRQTAPVLDILARDHAIAGVNGDFFDIGHTGAPLGLGLDRERGLLHAPRDGWNSAFLIDSRGQPDIATLPMRARLKEHRNFAITNVNSPRIRPGGIGIYTQNWGKSAGYRVTDGQRRNVRMVRIRNGRVVGTNKKLTSGTPIQDQMLIGRGRGAWDLAKLKVGNRATLQWWLKGAPRMAISGDRILVRDGIVEVVNDRILHPRTAVGIDGDTGEILILAIDGRQSFSRGYTMVELANQMIDLGADEALNLDGGGSTTMVAKKANGVIGVINSPSDGFARSVANALQVTYSAPR